MVGGVDRRLRLRVEELALTLFRAGVQGEGRGVPDVELSMASEFGHVILGFGHERDLEPEARDPHDLVFE